MKNHFTNGIILLIVGIVLMVVSQSTMFAREISIFGTGLFFEEEDSLLKSLLFLVGIALLVGGGIMIAKGGQNTSSSDE